MREIYLVNSKPHSDIKTIVIGQIEYFNLVAELKSANINLDEIKSSFNAVVFTSQNAIISLEKSIKLDKRLAVFKEIDAYVIGQFSAKMWSELGGNVKYISKDSNGSLFAKEIAPILKGKKAIYFRASKIVSKIDEILLKENVSLKQIIAYTNQMKVCDLSMRPTDRAILIFTSPSHYDSFKRNFGWHGSYIAIAIGMTTFSAFDYEVEGLVSPVCSIDGCIEFAKSLQEKVP